MITERTNAHRVNADRLRAIAVEAAEQCERLTVPSVHPPVALATLLADWPARTGSFSCRRANAAARAIRSGPWARAALLVGPEGGFTPAELDALRRASLCNVGIARPAHPAGRDRLHRRAGIVAGGGLRLVPCDPNPPRLGATCPIPETPTRPRSRRSDNWPTISPLAASRREQFRIGTEHEKFGFRLTDLDAPPYQPADGQPGSIRDLLAGLQPDRRRRRSWITATPSG